MQIKKDGIHWPGSPERNTLWGNVISLTFYIVDRGWSSHPPQGPVNFRKVLNGTMSCINRREWACSFRLRQQLSLHKQSRNGPVFMSILLNSKIKAVSQGGFADGMSKPIPYSFVQPNTIQRDIPELLHSGGGKPPGSTEVLG